MVVYDSGDNFTITGYVLFLYCVSMTLWYLYLANQTCPGYLSADFKTPLTEKGLAPVQIIRLYNMRHWLANEIYTFEEYCEDPSWKEQVPKQTLPGSIIDINQLTPLE